MRSTVPRRRNRYIPEPTTYGAKNLGAFGWVMIAHDYGAGWVKLQARSSAPGHAKSAVAPFDLAMPTNPIRLACPVMKDDVWSLASNVGIISPSIMKIEYAGSISGGYTLMVDGVGSGLKLRNGAIAGDWEFITP